MSEAPLPVRVLTRQDLLSQPNRGLPGAERDGTVRVAYHGLRAGTFRSTLVVMPADQSSPARDSEIEHIIYVLAGAFEFVVDGQPYLVHEMDQIFVPVGVRWEYRNAAPRESTFLSITGP